MPYPVKLQFALDYLIRSKFLASEENTSGCLIQKEEHQYLLIEDEETGYSELTVLVSETNLCIKKFDDSSFPLWGIIDDRKDIGMRKSVDHILLTKSENGKWKAHLIEMKTGMGNNTFEHVREKTRANYFSVKALCVYFGIELSDDDFDVYVTYENMRLSSDTAKLKAPLGKKPSNTIKSEWEKNRIIIKIPDELELNLYPIKMERTESVVSPSGEALIGEITI